MFEWITGPRLTNAIEELQADDGYENTIVDAPETPAHQFALKAFKHAVFGTPAVEDAATSKKLQKKPSPDTPSSKAPTRDAPGPSSPTKQPGGILMTPGTVNKGRKTVSFGAQVVDNEGKRGNVSRSGIPNDCPGKFPSPWTPATELKLDTNSEQRPRTKLTAALMDARTTTQPQSGQKPKAKDDSDITLDFGAPRSDSGKYWKEQYDSYKEISEKEVKQLINHRQLAKDYARKKDDEAAELASKLEQERKRWRRRELELEQQNKEFQERLRKAMGENTAAGMEITALKNRVATLEKANPTSSSRPQENEPAFDIYEDAGRNANVSRFQENQWDASHLSQKVRVPSIGKENSPPKPRLSRRQTLQEPSHLASSISPGPRVEAGRETTLLGRSARTIAREDATPMPSPAALQAGRVDEPVLSVRKLDLSHSNQQPKSPVANIPSSPLPLGTPGHGPDPWMAGADESIVATLDKLAMPIPNGGGASYSRPARSASSRRHEASKSVSQVSRTAPVRPSRTSGDRSTAPKKEAPATSVPGVEEPKFSKVELSIPNPSTQDHRESVSYSAKKVERVPPRADPAVSEYEASKEASKSNSHQPEGYSQQKRDRRQPLPEDRRAKAKSRAAERKKQRELSAQ